MLFQHDSATVNKIWYILKLLSLNSSQHLWDQTFTQLRTWPCQLQSEVEIVIVPY